MEQHHTDRLNNAHSHSREHRISYIDDIEQRRQQDTVFCCCCCCCFAPKGGSTHQVWTFPIFCTVYCTHVAAKFIFFIYIFAPTFVCWWKPMWKFFIWYWTVCLCVCVRVCGILHPQRTLSYRRKNSIFKSFLACLCDVRIDTNTHANTCTQIFGAANKFWQHIRYSNV